MDRLEAMDMFIRVADARSFSAAAKSVGLSQATASRVIAGLEAHLGVSLLERSTRGMVLTAPGHDFYHAAVDILSRVATAETRAVARQASPSGTIRVSSPSAFGQLHLVPYLDEFFHRYPGLVVEIEAGSRDFVQVRSDFDVAIRVGATPDDIEATTRIGSIQYVTVGAPSFLRTHGAPTTPGDVERMPGVVMTSGGASRPWHFDGPEGPVSHFAQARMRTNDAVQARGAVARGLGLGHDASYLYAPLVETGELVPVLDAFRPAPVPVSAVLPPGRRAPRKTEAFIEFLAERFARVPQLSGMA